MRNTSLKSNKKFLGIIILCILALVAGVLALNFGGTSLYAHAAEIECCDNSEHEHSTQATFSNLNGMTVLNQAYLSAHYADGTMGMILDETYDPDEVVFEPFAYTHLQRSTVMSSGKPDSQSIVAVFLGDGFDSSNADQDLFLDRVDKIAKHMIKMEPFNYYKDYLTVYAVHSISNQSGISGEAGGAFACRNAAGNPATPQCTPVDSAVFNCTHGRDTFYNSYYQWRSSANRVILEMASADRARARNHALAACSSANMVQVIANSSMRGGTSQMPTASQPLGVALTSINTANPSGDWKEVIMHEFGHGFGGLWDEYWNGITPAEYPNMTKINSTTTVKWSQWVGYKSISVFPFAASEYDGNPNQVTNPWFRPHQNCMMRQTSNPFCAVCVHELLGRMATATGFALFNTTNTGTNNIRIDKLNISVNGTFDIPERINGRIVTEIGSSAFANSGMSQITIPASVTSIGGSAFENCNNLSSIYISSNVQTINQKAFSGCNNLDISVSSNNPNYSVSSNILYNKNKTQIIASGKITNEIVIPNSVTEIMSYAFDGNTNLNTLRFGNVNPIIGKFSFNDCNNLTNVYFDSFDKPQMGELAFPSNNFALYTPYISRTSYGDFFANYTTDLRSETFTLNLIVDGVTQTHNVNYGANIVELVAPNKLGYTFVGWYDNANFAGKLYSNNGVWETKNDVTLYAKFKPNKYNIIFEGEGIENIAPKEIVYGNAVGILPQVAREGYTFIGWKSQNEQFYTENTIWQNTNNIILTAEWNANEYEITLDTNGGVGNGQNTIAVTFGSLFSTSNIPTKEGYVFEGWFDNQNIKYIMSNGECTRTWDKAEDTTLSAKWQIKSYEIQINGNGKITWLGATGLSNVQSSIEYGTQIDAINLVYAFKNSSHGYKDGNIFDHFEYEQTNIDWTTIPDLGENGAIVTITPIWVKENNIIYFNTQCDIAVDEIELLYDSNINLPININRNGYSFNGWYNRQSGGEKIEWNKMPDLTPNAQNNGSITLYAQYNIINYSITYELEGGANSYANPTVYNIEYIINFENPTKYGNDFIGWYLDASKINRISVLKNEFGNKTLYAKWAPKVVQIIFDKQGGNGGINEVSATYNSSMPNAVAPIRKGYLFKGYYSQPNGVGDKYYNSSMDSEKDFDNLDHTALYAYWVANTYTIKLDYSHSAMSGTKNITVTYGLPMPTIELPTYQFIVFEGYYTGKEGSGEKYYNYNGASCKNWDLDKEVILYAKWVQTIAMGEQGNFDSGSLNTKFTNWRTYIDFSSSESEYNPLDYNTLKTIGYTKVEFSFSGLFNVYGLVTVEIRCYNVTKNKQIGSIETYNSSNGANDDLSYSFETDLAEVDNGDKIEIQLRYKKVKALWGGNFEIESPKAYFVQAL